MELNDNMPSEMVENNKKSNAKGALKFIIFSPLSVFFNLLSKVMMLVGVVSSIGLLIGLYFLYFFFSRVFVTGHFGMLSDLWKGLMFVGIPLGIYTIAFLFDFVHKYLDKSKRTE